MVETPSQWAGSAIYQACRIGPRTSTFCVVSDKGLVREIAQDPLVDIDHWAVSSDGRRLVWIGTDVYARRAIYVVSTGRRWQERPAGES